MGGLTVCHGATEILVYIIVETKVVFTRNSSRVRLEGAAIVTADVEKVCVMNLVELYCGTTSCCMSTNIHVIHWLILTVTKIYHDIKVAELASEVISVINLFHFVKGSLHFIKAVGCSPICRVAAGAFHSSQSLAIRVPIWSLVVDWCVLRKSLALKLRQIFIFSVPGHD